jgi:putative aldouronate transport system permease protein
LPILATIILFTAIGHWNSWFDSYAFTYKHELKTLGLYLVRILNEYATYGMRSDSTSLIDSRMRNPVSPDSIRMTVTIVSTVPILLVYPFVQKFFVKGIMIGALKV